MSGEALYAKPVLESILDRTLVIWDADGRQGAVDLRAFDGPTLSIEVKQITNSDLRIAHSRALGTALQFHGSALLTRFWTLIPEVSPPPDYAKVASNAESILVSMEEKGMFESWRLAPEFVSVEDWSERLKVWKELRSLLGGGIAQGVEANAEFPSGFVILLGYGTVSPTDPNKSSSRSKTCFVATAMTSSDCANSWPTAPTTSGMPSSTSTPTSRPTLEALLVTSLERFHPDLSYCPR